MNSSLEALESEVLRLPTSDRVRLLDRVVASLDADAARDAAWDALAARRDAEIEADPSAAVPLDEAAARLRAELG
jgi:putative addiction module component (TIGR02574 family)